MATKNAVEPWSSLWCMLLQTCAKYRWPWLCTIIGERLSQAYRSKLPKTIIACATVCNCHMSCDLVIRQAAIHSDLPCSLLTQLEINMCFYWETSLSQSNLTVPGLNRDEHCPTTGKTCKPSWLLPSSICCLAMPSGALNCARMQVSCSCFSLFGVGIGG